MLKRGGRCFLSGALRRGNCALLAVALPVHSSTPERTPEACAQPSEARGKARSETRPPVRKERREPFPAHPSRRGQALRRHCRSVKQPWRRREPPTALPPPQPQLPSTWCRSRTCSAPPPLTSSRASPRPRCAAAGALMYGGRGGRAVAERAQATTGAACHLPPWREAKQAPAGQAAVASHTQGPGAARVQLEAPPPHSPLPRRPGAMRGELSNAGLERLGLLPRAAGALAPAGAPPASTQPPLNAGRGAAPEARRQ